MPEKGFIFREKFCCLSCAQICMRKVSCFRLSFWFLWGFWVFDTLYQSTQKNLRKFFAWDKFFCFSRIFGVCFLKGSFCSGFLTDFADSIRTSLYTTNLILKNVNWFFWLKFFLYFCQHRKIPVSILIISVNDICNF